jgi:hypothetical protein
VHPRRAPQRGRRRRCRRRNSRPGTTFPKASSPPGEEASRSGATVDFQNLMPPQPSLRAPPGRLRAAGVPHERASGGARRRGAS